LLSGAEFEEMRLRNRRNDPQVCASHDFCDANVVMAAAFAEVTGEEPDTVNCEGDLNLWNDAWGIARRDFLTALAPETKAEVTRRDCNAILAWPNEEGRYYAGFFIGSEGENGEHLREINGWPFSIYKKGREPGVTDACLCTGIQSFTDADALCAMLNRRAHDAC
jgi:hypothetical protein